MTTATATLPNLTAGTWTIDTVHSTVGFSVRHLMVSKVRGTFNDFAGAITVAEDGTTAVTAEIQVASIDTKNTDRDAHIKSADFFDAEQYPTATFTSTAVRAKGDDYVVEGDFTLTASPGRSSSPSSSTASTPAWATGRSPLRATTVLNRKDFGITIDMPLEGGGAVVGDKITITLEIEAGLQA